MQEVTIFENKLRLSISDEFCLVQEPEAVEMFPYQDRPQFIFATAGFSRFLTFSLLEKNLGRRKLHRCMLLQFDLEVDAVTIRNERVSFSYCNLFEGKARMLLPAHFVQMPDAWIKQGWFV